MALQNLFHPAVSVGDTQASFGDGIKLESNMDALLEVIMKTETLSQLPDRANIEVLAHATGHGGKYFVRYNKVLVGMLLYPLDEHLMDTTGEWDRPVPTWVEEAAAVPNPFNAEEWLDKLKSAANDDPTILCLIDSLPPCLRDLEQVGKTHVIVPDSYNMTEEMVDASRSLLLYSDTFGDHKAESIRDQIALRPWIRKNLPQWFAEQKGHLTKAGRADLAYHLTLQAYLNPPIEAEKHFAPTFNERKPSSNDFYYGLEIQLKTADAALSLSKAYESFWTKASDGDMFDLRINRHELPEAWRGFFKKQAIEVSGKISKDEAGVIVLAYPKIRLGLKGDHASTVAYDLLTSVQIPKKQVRNVIE